jgi:glucose-6-phosphate 1-dehydrogenase
MSNTTTHNPTPAVHVGQYEGYREHVAEDRKVSEPHFLKTTVPTAAAVTLGSADPRWAGVEFVLKAGKALDGRTSYAKATLRTPRGHAQAQAQAQAAPCELLFNIQGGALGTAAIAWDVRACAGLLDPGRVHVPLGWVRSEEEGLLVLRPAAGEAAPNAYDVVVEEVLEGDQSMFLGTEVCVGMWGGWVDECVCACV